MKSIYLVIFMLFSASVAWTQQELHMTNYLFNGLYWNPGYAGSNDFVRTTAMYRHQWTALKGAPRTLMASADIPFTLDNMGLAIQLTHDRIGVSDMTDIYATYAYHIKLNDNLRLGLGIKAGVSNYSSRLSELEVWDNDDDLFADVQNVLMPKVGFGAFLHAEKFYVGVSVPTLWSYYSPAYNFNLNINRSSFLRRHLFASAAYVFTLNEDFKLKPSVFTKYVPNAPFQADVNATVIWRDRLHLSFGYRSNAAAMLMLEVQPIDNLRIGYSFDLSTPQYLRVYGGTSHEIMLGYDIQRKETKFRSPRHF